MPTVELFASLGMVARLVRSSCGDSRDQRERSPRRHGMPLTLCASDGYYARAGWSSQVARRAHNPEVAGSNPSPATIRPTNLLATYDSFRTVPNPGFAYDGGFPLWLFHSRVLRNARNRKVKSLSCSTPCMKTGFLPQSSPPRGETRERERAVETIFSTAC